MKKLWCDSDICYCCGMREPQTKAKSPRKLIEVHHIKHQCDGGSNEPDNLICLCSSCHSKFHLGTIKESVDSQGNLWTNFGWAKKLNWIDEDGNPQQGPIYLRVLR